MPVDHAVFGVLELRLEAWDEWGCAPAGVKVRVQLGAVQWPSAAQLHAIASSTVNTAQVEVFGVHGAAIAEVVRYLRQHRFEQAEVERQWAQRQAQWAVSRDRWRGGVA